LLTDLHLNSGNKGSVLGQTSLYGKL